MLRGAEVFPEPRKRAVAVERELDAVAGTEWGTGKHRDAERELRLGRSDRGAVGSGPTDVLDRGPARDLKQADEGEEQDNRPERPTTDALDESAVRPG